MPILIKFSRLIDSISEFLGKISMFLVIVTVVVGFYNVVARYIGKSVGMQLSSNTFIEVQWYLYSLVFFFGFAYLMKNGGNVRVDFIYANWTQKSKALLDFCGNLLFVVPFCILGIYVSISPVLRSWGRLPNGDWGMWEVSADPGGLPRAPIKSMIIIAFTFLLLQTVSELIKHWAIIRERTELLPELPGEGEAPLRIE